LGKVSSVFLMLSAKAATNFGCVGHRSMKLHFRPVGELLKDERGRSV
jgi:hypothetical protein